MPPETHVAMVTFLKPVTCPDPNYANTNIKRYLNDTSPRPLSPHLEAPFVPLFPRNPLPDHTGPTSNRPAPMGLTGVSDLPSHASTVKLEGEEMDLINEHMRVVDGWRTLPANPLFFVLYLKLVIETYAPSSPMTPQSDQSDPADEIDELFSPSSPNTEVTPIQMLMNATMGEFCLGVLRVQLCHCISDHILTPDILCCSQKKYRSHAQTNVEAW
jgi:hypothetical protein